MLERLTFDLKKIKTFHRIRWIRRSFLLYFSPLLIFSLSTNPPSAQEEKPVAPATIPEKTVLSKDSGLASIFDGIIESALEQKIIQGAVVGAIQNGEPVFLKGYGYASQEPEQIMDPEQTVIRAGSVSKLFTGALFLQLAAEGLLDLHSPLDKRIGQVSIPDGPQEQPITPVHLFTHTAGFDERLTGISSDREEIEIDLARYLNETMPPRIRPAGKYYSYSNHGISIAGYMAEVAAKKPFHLLAQERILSPLKMESSSFVLSDSLEDRLARSYAYSGGQWVQVPHMPIRSIPAGSLYTTARDMIRFLQANTRFRPESKRILDPSSLQTFHKNHWKAHPDMPGAAFAYYERLYKGNKALEHGGDWEGFSSHLLINPDTGNGYFVSLNGSNDFLIREKLADSWMEHFYKKSQTTGVGDPYTSPSKMDLSEDQLNEYGGSFRISRYEQTGYLKIAGMIQEVTIESDPKKNELVVSFPFNFREPMRLVPVKKDLFFSPEDQVYAYFHREGDSKDGPIVAISTKYMVLWTLEKIHPLWGFPVQYGILFYTVIIILLIFFTWPIIATLARRKKKLANHSQMDTSSESHTGIPTKNSPAKNDQRTGALSASWLVYGSIVWILFFMILYATASAFLVTGVPPFIHVILWMPVFSIAFLLGLIRFYPIIHKQSGWGVYRRILYTNAIVAHVLFLFFAWNWNLMAPALF